MEVFYFKVNRGDDPNIKYIQQWANHIKAIPESQVYVICDKTDLTEYLKVRINFGNVPHEFIKSIRESKELQYIIESAMVPGWRPAAYAHLTPFLHSRDNNYKDFWNIDADDIGLYAEPHQIAKLLSTIKNYANHNNIDLFSLDIHRTSEMGQHWSFGVVYTNNALNWLELMTEHCRDKFLFERYRFVRSGLNMDWYFTYLRTIKAAAIETFYVENLRIIHHTNDVYRKSDACAGLKYFSNGRCYYPVLCNDFGMGETGAIKIWDDVIKIDTGITAEESIFFLRKCCTSNLCRFEYEHGINIPISVILVPNKNLEGTPPPAVWRLCFNNSLANINLSLSTTA